MGGNVLLTHDPGIKEKVGISEPVCTNVDLKFEICTWFEPFLQERHITAPYWFRFWFWFFSPLGHKTCLLYSHTYSYRPMFVWISTENHMLSNIQVNVLVRTGLEIPSSHVTTPWLDQSVGDILLTCFILCAYRSHCRVWGTFPLSPKHPKVGTFFFVFFWITRKFRIPGDTLVLSFAAEWGERSSHTRSPHHTYHIVCMIPYYTRRPGRCCCARLCTRAAGPQRCHEQGRRHARARGYPTAPLRGPAIGRVRVSPITLLYTSKY